MSIDISSSDVEAVYAAIVARKLLDPEVKKRVHQRAEAVRDEIRRKHGILNAAVDLIRESRDE
jgi:hypothetical protein